MAEYIPRQGDYFLTQIPGVTGWWVRAAQWFTGDASRYTHGGVYLGSNMCIEAMPRGARLIRLDEIAARRPLAWSVGDLTDQDRSVIAHHALSFVGVGYGWATYLSLAALHFGLKPRRLRAYVAGCDRLICSQLVDAAYDMAGVHLFDDGRAPGDVTPGDLAHVGVIANVGTGPYITED